MTRYAQCDDTCTVDCGHCKGEGRPDAPPLTDQEAVTAASSPSNQQRAAEYARARWDDREEWYRHRDAIAAALDDATVRGYNAGWEAGLERGRAEMVAKIEALAEELGDSVSELSMGYAPQQVEELLPEFDALVQRARDLAAEAAPAGQEAGR